MGDVHCFPRILVTIREWEKMEVERIRIKFRKYMYIQYKWRYWVKKIH